MALPVFDDGLDTAEMSEMMDNARRATNFLKALAHEGRLMILCHLASGEKSVTELEGLLSTRQAAVSQQLARLRLEGLVEYRREGKAIYYSLGDDRARRMIETVYEMFCNPPLSDASSREATKQL
ncbi:MAG: metalloregulator ArsR/SmtB family transcription factor [Rhodobacteraceae bacterium]|nr:metalloregulator ArsR/SmtB family transcription factor [Paracoccaceae bacterium]